MVGRQREREDFHIKIWALAPHSWQPVCNSLWSPLYGAVPGSVISVDGLSLAAFSQMWQLCKPTPSQLLDHSDAHQRVRGWGYFSWDPRNPQICMQCKWAFGGGSVGGPNSVLGSSSEQQACCGETGTFTGGHAAGAGREAASGPWRGV